MAGRHAFTYDCLSAAFADHLYIAVSNCSFDITTAMGSAGVYEKINGPVCVDCKTRLVPFRLVRSQSVFANVYVNLCLSLSLFGLIRVIL